MDYCPYLDRLIDLEADEPIGPELEFHLLICEECEQDWETIRLIRSMVPDKETAERDAKRLGELIPVILANLPPPLPSPGRRKAHSWSFLEWGPWRRKRRLR